MTTDWLAASMQVFGFFKIWHWMNEVIDCLLNISPQNIFNAVRFGNLVRIFQINGYSEVMSCCDENKAVLHCNK
jgi:hypothetical protein